MSAHGEASPAAWHGSPRPPSGRAGGERVIEGQDTWRVEQSHELTALYERVRAGAAS